MAGQAAHATETGNGGCPAKAGQFVAVTPRNGEVYPMGSEPTFDPSLFTKPISEKKFKQLNSEANGAPLFNRAIAAAYPTGSTFKPITAMAALESGILTPSQIINDDGGIKLGPRTLRNARNPSYGPIKLSEAL